MNSLSPADIVIVGGGAVGCGVAYCLAQAGKTNVLLLDKEPRLAAVTTSQGAGLAGQVRTTVERTRLAMNSIATFAQLEREGEPAPGWRQVGSLRIALTDARVAEFAHMKRVADEAGLAVEFLDPAVAERKFPHMRFREAKAILWCPTDGHLSPIKLAAAYRDRASRLGVRFETGVTVYRILTSDGSVTGVETNRGMIPCQTVVNAAGAHAFHLARTAGLELPIVPVRHEYFVTVEAPGLAPDVPDVRIPDETLYLRTEGETLWCGGWEPQALSLDPREFGIEVEPRLDPDERVLASFVDKLAPFFPAVRELRHQRIARGWPTFTPDGRFLIGESRRVRGLVMAGGCNAHGVSGSAGIGKHVVEAMFDENPSDYVKSLNPDRCLDAPWDWESARREAQSHYETYYALSDAGYGGV